MSRFGKVQFHAAAIGPEGGALHKRSLERTKVLLYHDSANVNLEISGRLEDEKPLFKVIAIDAWPGDFRERVFYEGPISGIFEPTPLETAARAAVQAHYYGEDHEAQAAMEVLRSLLGWNFFAAPVAPAEPAGDLDGNESWAKLVP